TLSKDGSRDLSRPRRASDLVAAAAATISPTRDTTAGGGEMDNGDRPITIITGGGRGIGAATAVQLAQAGHDLTLAYRKDDAAAQETAAQAQAAGAKCVLAKVDITRQDDGE